MIIPYTYREFDIEGFYDPVEQGGEMVMAFTAIAGSEKFQIVCTTSQYATWEEAKAAIETQIDELIASWN